VNARFAYPLIALAAILGYVLGNQFAPESREEVLEVKYREMQGHAWYWQRGYAQWQRVLGQIYGRS